MSVSGGMGYGTVDKKNDMQKRILQALTMIVCLFLSSIAQAQKITATARIKLETGEAAESVSILVKGTKQGTTTMRMVTVKTKIY